MLSPCPGCHEPCRFLTYICQFLGATSGRLTEIAEDLHARKIHVADIRGTCWKHDHGRSGWIVRSRKGQPLYHCLLWGKSGAQAHNGVMLLLWFSVFGGKHFTQRFDPSKHNAGRIGGVRVVRKWSTGLFDHTFITAYASINTATHFLTELQQQIQSAPALTSVWLLGEFNAHIGIDLQYPAAAEASLDNENQLARLCNATQLALVSTCHVAGHTWWAPGRNASHRPDYIAISSSARKRVKRCISPHCTG